jgi:hypothetical protein
MPYLGDPYADQANAAPTWEAAIAARQPTAGQRSGFPFDLKVRVLAAARRGRDIRQIVDRWGQGLFDALSTEAAGSGLSFQNSRPVIALGYSGDILILFTPDERTDGPAMQTLTQRAELILRDWSLRVFKFG